MSADTPDPTDPMRSAGSSSPDSATPESGTPESGTTKTAQTPASKSSVAWAVVAGLIVVAVTFLIYVWMTSSDPDEGASDESAAGAATAGVTPSEEMSSVAESETGAGDTPAPATTPAPADPEVAGDAAQQSASQELTPEQEAFLLDLQRRDADDVMALGEVDAPVVLIEYSDFRCPFCARWATDVKPEMQPYLDDGTLRIEYHDLALLGPESASAAVAARAAGEQGKYWEFHDALFAATSAGDHPDMPADKLVEMATEVGVPDIAAFEAGLTSPDLIQAVEAETASARELGITSTPTFLINTAIVQGAQPANVFIETVESEAEKAAE